MPTPIIALVSGLLAVTLLADPVTLKLEDFTHKSASDKAPDNVGYDADAKKLFFYNAGTATAPVKLDAGDYTLVVEASCDEGDKEKAKMSVKLGDKVIEKSFELKETGQKEYEFKLPAIKGGEAKLEIGFLNDAYKENEYDRNMYVHAVRFEKTAK